MTQALYAHMNNKRKKKIFLPWSNSEKSENIPNQLKTT
jgi:hypothetical protein